MVRKAIILIIITILLVVVQADDELSPSYPPAPYRPLFSSVDKINRECVNRCKIRCLAVHERLSPLCVHFLTVAICWRPSWRHPERDLSAAIKRCVLRCLPPTAGYRFSVPGIYMSKCNFVLLFSIK